MNVNVADPETSREEDQVSVRRPERRLSGDPTQERAAAGRAASARCRHRRSVPLLPLLLAL